MWSYKMTHHAIYICKGRSGASQTSIYLPYVLIKWSNHARFEHFRMCRIFTKHLWLMPWSLTPCIGQGTDMETPLVSWMVMDGADMAFEDNTFDAIIEKGTLDALICEEDDQVQLKNKTPLHQDPVSMTFVWKAFFSHEVFLAVIALFSDCLFVKIDSSKPTLAFNMARLCIWFWLSVLVCWKLAEPYCWWHTAALHRVLVITQNMYDVLISKSMKWFMELCTNSDLLESEAFHWSVVPQKIAYSASALLIRELRAGKMLVHDAVHWICSNSFILL